MCANKWIKNLNNGLSYDIFYIYPKLQKRRFLKINIGLNERR